MSGTSALGNKRQANYSAAKVRLPGFAMTLALELGKFGVTADAIAPGFIETDMTVAAGKRMGMSFDESKRAVTAQAPVSRNGLPENIARAVSFLVGEDTGFVLRPGAVRRRRAEA